MPINNITQTVSTIPAPPHRGVDVQTQFVIKQEDFQDHLQGTTVTELNALKTQMNTMAGEMNTTASQVNTSASTATTQAGIATTKASEASTSATSASTSASTATTSRNQAETFAQQAQASATSVDANNIVHRTNNESIAGVKTFSSSPILPTPTTGTQAVNKDYADSKVALASFTGTNQGLLGIGYQKLPGGLILQWGTTASITDGNGNFQITYPITFPTSPLTCIFSLGDKIAPISGTALTLSNNISIFGKSSMNINVTGYQNLNVAGASIRINWLVIGY